MPDLHTISLAIEITAIGLALLLGGIVVLIPALGPRR